MFPLLDFIFPPRCARCRAYLRHGGALCAGCRRRAVLHRTLFCAKCRARLYFPRRSCHRDFPFLLGAAGEYRDPVFQSLIRALKFGFVRDAAGELGALLAAYAARLRATRSYDLILPVPLSARRRRERGFNQAELIAREFSKRAGTPVAADALRRVRHTAPQSGLHEVTARRVNVDGCFEIARPAAVAGRSVIILDDVVTSGATIGEAVRAVRAAGGRNILALATAKA